MCITTEHHSIQRSIQVRAAAADLLTAAAVEEKREGGSGGKAVGKVLDDLCEHSDSGIRRIMKKVAEAVEAALAAAGGGDGGDGGDTEAKAEAKDGDGVKGSGAKKSAKGEGKSAKSDGKKKTKMVMKKVGLNVLWYQRW